ncbi:MAG: hypothetical protein HW421_696 [Ignavibacteria bacterium]|nr:hypothetical protein [Ignavibacteria bacterium]
MEFSINIILIITNIICFAAAILLFKHVVRYRKEKYKIITKYESKRIIAEVPLSEISNVFLSGDFGTKIDAEVNILLNGDNTTIGGTSDLEAWILSVLAKKSAFMFEFGTATGKTTYLWARNSHDNAQIITITLPPEKLTDYSEGKTDSSDAALIAKKESLFTKHYYTGTGVEKKITQIYGDSKQFDESPFLEKCDLIFIDGSHAYSYVKSDTEKAIRMLKPGGIALWHDYRGPRHETKDVYFYLNELSKEIPLLHLRNTSLVAYKKPF